MLELFINDEVTRALLPRFEQAGAMLREAIDQQRTILVKFDNDADGISAAFSIMEALEGLGKEHTYPLQLLRAVRSEGAVYSLAEAHLDIGNAARLEKKPLLVFLDCAGNDTSVPALAKLKEAGFLTLVIDHHPTPAREVEKAVNILVSPWAVADKGSEYPTALLAYEVARRAWPPQGVRREYALWGLQSDKSHLAPSRNLKEPHVLDYLATYSDAASCLPKYRRELADPVEVNRLYDHAMERVKLGLEEALSHTKVKQFKKLSLAIVKLGGRSMKWPPKGRLMNDVHDHWSQKLQAPLVSIGYGDDKIMFRANHQAFEVGFRANEFIQQLKEETEEMNAIESGGGHEVAAAMKVKPEHLKTLITRLTQMIEQRFS